MIASPDLAQRRVTVAVVQLTCHPSITVGATNYAREPFMVESNETPVLRDLANHGLDMRDHMQYCHDRYLVWHFARIRAVMEWLENVKPVPNVVVFPEGAIPRHLLSWLRKSTPAKLSRSLTIAGTHAFEDTREAWDDYKKNLGIPSDVLEKLRLRGRQPTATVLAALHPQDSGEPRRVQLILKERLSPFEETAIGESEKQSDTADAAEMCDSEETSFSCPGTNMRIEVFVCSEVLQFLGHDRARKLENSLVVVPSHDAKPENFDHPLRLLAANQVPTVYCNDGAYGGSKIVVEPDKRGENAWFKSPNNGCLPPGDGILVLEVTLGHSGPQHGVFNPAVFHRLIRLAPIVSWHDGLPEWRAARQLNRLRSDVENTITRPSYEKILEGLDELIDWTKPTPIQRVQIDRLRALALEGRLPLQEWEVFSDACEIKVTHLEQAHKELTQPVPPIVGTPEPQDEIRGTPRVCKNLRLLEKELARHCLVRIGWLESPEGNQDRAKSDALRRARSRLNKVIGEAGPLRPDIALTQYIERCSAQAREEAQIQLTNRVAKLVERFHATSGMLFIVVDDLERQSANESDSSKKLVARVMCNVLISEKERKIAQTGQGIVGRVAHEKTAYLSNCVIDGKGQSIDEYYRDTVRSTRAELAVPVFAPSIDSNSVELVGVLNLESHTAGSFSPVQVSELETAALELAPDIRVLQFAARHDRAVLWHPNVHGWTLTELLDGFCHRVTSALHDSDDLSVSCTIWHADWEKQKLYVRGTARFDHEYESHSLLEWDSFMGSVAEGDVRKVHRETVSDIRSFRRKAKAARMEVSRVVATAIPHSERESDDGRPAAVLALYSFDHGKGPSNVAFDEVFSDSVMLRLRSWVARLVREVQELRTQVATALMHARLKAGSVPSFDDFEQIKRTVLECLDAHGATLFVKHQGQDELVCQTTTGLLGAVEDFRHSLPAEGEAHEDYGPFEGHTRFLGSRPGRTLRKLNVPDDSEWCGPANDRFQVRASQQARETGALSRWSHRRFVGTTVSKEEKVLGVIRLVRHENARPFVNADARLLAALGNVAVDVFALAAEPRPLEKDQRVKIFESLFAETHPTAGAEITFRPPGPYLHQPVAGNMAKRQNVSEAIFRLLSSHLHHPWNSRCWDAWLEDFLLAFTRSDESRPQPIYSSLRLVADEENADWYLDLLTYHSAHARQMAWDDVRLSRRDINIGWKAIDRTGNPALLRCQPRIIWFEKEKAKIYRCSLPSDDTVRFGLTIPTAWVAQHRYIQGVVTLDFDRAPEARDPTTMRAAFFSTITLGLATLSLKNGSLDVQPAMNSFGGWLEEVVRLNGCTWGVVFSVADESWQPIVATSRLPQTLKVEKLKEATKRSFPPYQRSNPQQRRRYELERLDATLPQDGVECGGGKHTIVGIPLRVGAFPLFHLFLGTDNLPANIASGEDLRRWADLIFAIAERWQQTLTLDSWFWRRFQLELQEDAKRTAEPTDEGLDFWIPQFVDSDAARKKA